MSELQRLAETSHGYAVCSSQSEEGRIVWVVAKAGFSVLGGNSPRIWPRPGFLLLLEEKHKKEGEFGVEVAPLRHLGQVASGSFHVINHKPSVAGMKQ